uniref:Uncharacterized protein n=1 Tax=viral metagenome TaxID=1070528 RepID=A0A6C0JAP5_9ZZZZ
MIFVPIIFSIVIISLSIYRYIEHKNEKFNFTLNTVLIVLFSILLIGYFLSKYPTAKQEYIHSPEPFFDRKEHLYYLYANVKSLIVNKLSDDMTQRNFNLENAKRIYMADDHSYNSRIRELERISKALNIL